MKYPSLLCLMILMIYNHKTNIAYLLQKMNQFLLNLMKLKNGIHKIMNQNYHSKQSQNQINLLILKKSIYKTFDIYFQLIYILLKI